LVEGRLMSIRSNKIILTLGLAAIIAIFMYMFFVPIGSYVYVLVEVRENSLNITEYTLRKLHMISIMRPEEDITIGNRKLILRVFFNQTEIMSSHRDNIGTGDCIIESSTLPQDIPINSELTIVAQLYDVKNAMIAQSQVLLIYR
jgi:hypothetical protein